MKPSTATALALGGLTLLLGLSAGRRGTSHGRSAVGRVPTAYLMRSASMIQSLDPSIQGAATELVAEAYLAGLPVVVASGRRTYEEQDALYAQGRTTPGAVVTNARAGQSWHNFGLAFDVAFVDASVPGGMGKVIWPWPEDARLWEWIGVLGERLGLTWGGRDASPDKPHFEYHPGIRLSDARAGARPTTEPVRAA